MYRCYKLKIGENDNNVVFADLTEGCAMSIKYKTKNIVVIDCKYEYNTATEPSLAEFQGKDDFITQNANLFYFILFVKFGSVVYILKTKFLNFSAI